MQSKLPGLFLVGASNGLKEALFNLASALSVRSLSPEDAAAIASWVESLTGIKKDIDHQKARAEAGGLTVGQLAVQAPTIPDDWPFPPVELDY